MKKVLRLILGDQLNQAHGWYSAPDDQITYLMMEMRQETDYATHHIQKIMLFFAAMRAHAAWLESNKHQVIYYTLDDSRNKQSLRENIIKLIDELDIQRFEYQLPDEYRLDLQIKMISKEVEVEVQSYDTEHFFTTRNQLTEFLGNKNAILEYYYRDLRKKHNILMDDGEPVGGQWNFDSENRKKIPKTHQIPDAKKFSKDLSPIKEMIDASNVQYIGDVEAENFLWPTTRKEHLKMLQYFCNDLLPYFGKYQDAMVERSWTGYHSRISFGLNAKLLSPREVIDQVLKTWKHYPERIDIAQVEGFIRQILGWREFMRGIYWKHMPEYATLNHLNHKEPLPSYFWTAKTKMNCIANCVKQTLKHGYAHHIQRLMITGNFSLLAGVHPDEVDDWYLGVYIDALDWVEITNTRGMSQYADGGIVGSKPYVSSANYINKMSDYCSKCSYDHKKRHGQNACPFNSLYWNFLDRNKEILSKNPRMAMTYRVWNRFDDVEQSKILKQASAYLEKVESL